MLDWSDINYWATPDNDSSSRNIERRYSLLWCLSLIYILHTARSRSEVKLLAFVKLQRFLLLRHTFESFTQKNKNLFISSWNMSIAMAENFYYSYLRASAWFCNFPASSTWTPLCLYTGSSTPSVFISTLWPSQHSLQDRHWLQVQYGLGHDLLTLSSPSHLTPPMRSSSPFLPDKLCSFSITGVFKVTDSKLLSPVPVPAGLRPHLLHFKTFF